MKWILLIVALNCIGADINAQKSSTGEAYLSFTKDGGSATDRTSAMIYAGNGLYLVAGSSSSDNGDAVGALGDTDAWLFMAQPIQF